MPAKAAKGERIMPVHAWTRVTAGTFHDFHNAWIAELRNALNGGVLPDERAVARSAEPALDPGFLLHQDADHSLC
jgi:hypothetical protein